MMNRRKSIADIIDMLLFDIWAYYPLIALIVVILIIIAICIGSPKISQHNSDILWNDGYCQCGGHYEYQQAVGHFAVTNYIYMCDNCKSIIEVDTYYG